MIDIHSIASDNGIEIGSNSFTDIKSLALIHSLHLKAALFL
jgi:hypothetical protein